jgi:hypothetical protein
MYLSIQLLQRDVVFDVDVIRKGVYNVSICGCKLGRIVCFHVRCGVVLQLYGPVALAAIAVSDVEVANLDRRKQKPI